MPHADPTPRRFTTIKLFKRIKETLLNKASISQKTAKFMYHTCMCTRVKNRENYSHMVHERVSTRVLKTLQIQYVTVACSSVCQICTVANRHVVRFAMFSL